jgi:hypothetical protein
MQTKDKLILLSALWLIFVCLAASVSIARSLHLLGSAIWPCIEIPYFTKSCAALPGPALSII